MKSTELTKTETAELHRCEAVIERGLATFYEVGTALLKIHDERLYRASSKTFEEYCRQKWSIDRRYANRLIQASAVVEDLGSMDPIPTAERQIRSLADLKPELQRTVWQQAVSEADGKQPTAAQVEEVSETVRQLIQQKIAEREREGPEPFQTTLNCLAKKSLS